MPTTLKLEIVTPEGKVFSDDVEMVCLRAAEGQIGILPQHHIHLITHMLPGKMLVRKNGHDQFLAVGEGLVEISGNSVAIATDMAIAVESIDEARADETPQTSQARLRDKLSNDEVASVSASLTGST